MLHKLSIGLLTIYFSPSTWDVNVNTLRQWNKHFGISVNVSLILFTH